MEKYFVFLPIFPTIFVKEPSITVEILFFIFRCFYFFYQTVQI